MFRVCKKCDEIPEVLKLLFLREICICHKTIVQGLTTLVQLSCLVVRIIIMNEVE